MSPPADRRRLRAGDDLRLGHAAGVRRPAPRSRAASISCRSAISSPRVDSACSSSAVERGHRRAARPATVPRRSASGSAASLEEARQRRLRARAIGRGRREVRLDVEHLALGAKPIESRRVAGGLALREDVRQLAQPIARGGQLALSRLRRDAGRQRRGAGRRAGGAPRRRRGSTLADTSADAACDVESPAAGDRQRLRHHRQVLGHAGDRLAIEGQPRIRPARTPPARRRARRRRRRGSPARADCRATAAPGRRIRSASTIARRRWTARRRPPATAQSTALRITPRREAAADDRSAAAETVRTDDG